MAEPAIRNSNPAQVLVEAGIFDTPSIDSCVLDAIPAYVWLKDTENRILWANRAAAVTAGLQPGALDGRHTEEIYPHAAQYYEDDLQVIRSGVPKLAIFEPVVGGDGQERWLRTDKIPVADLDGNVRAIIVVSTELTGISDETATREAVDAQLRYLLFQSSTAVWEWQPGNDQFFISPRAASILDVPVAELPESLDSFCKLLRADSRGSFTQALEQAVNGGEELELRLRVASETARVRWLRCIGHRSETVRGGVRIAGQLQPLEFYLTGEQVLRDVPSRIRQQLVEETRRRKAESLGHAQHASLLAEVASVLAHQMSQPLFTLGNYTRGCAVRVRRDEMEKEQLLDVFEKMQRAVDQAGQSLRKLQGAVQRPSGTTQVVFLTEILDTVLNAIGDEAKNRDVAIHSELTSETPPVVVDPVQIEQVFLSLLENAIDAAAKNHQNEKWVTISARPADPGFLNVEIQDNGPGIDSDTLAHVQEPFYSTREGALGMGLVICRSILEMIGCRMWIQSEPDNGTQVRFNLPTNTK